MSKFIPEIHGDLRKFMLKVPEEIYGCSGIRIFGKRIKSVVFSTDVSIIRNTNADAVIAVYPFTPQPIITRSLTMAADIPVFCGVGGGRTTGLRVVDLAVEAERQGAMGVVVNAPTPNETIRMVKEHIDIPIVVTVVRDSDDIGERIKAGAQIVNVSAAQNTAAIVAKIRREYPEVAIMATGGPTPESIQATVDAGAHAISWTPPTTGALFSEIMTRYREGFTTPEKD